MSMYICRKRKKLVLLATDSFFLNDENIYLFKNKAVNGSQHIILKFSAFFGPLDSFKKDLYI